MTDPIQGTCEEMCPLNEQKKREREHCLHVLERTDQTRKSQLPKPNPARMVKEFVRSTFGFEPNASILRTERCLVETTRYLVHTVLNRKDEKWNVIYDFVNDRLRSIRQDMIIQQIVGRTLVTVLENCVLFHILASYKLCDAPLRMFDSHLNTKFLNECLDSLLFEYDHHPIDAFKHRPMFESAFLLLNQNKPNVYDRLRFISPSLRNQDRFLIASRLLIRARAIRNYSFILNRFDKLPFAMAICLNTQISTIQFEYLRCLSYSSASRNATIPLRKVADLICPFEGDSAAALSYVTELAKSAGISCTPDHLKAEKSGAFKPPPINKARKWSCFKQLEQEGDDMLGALFLTTKSAKSSK